ncbi:hypothetical protein QTO02_21710, partial [Vibrio fortis]
LDAIFTSVPSICPNMARPQNAKYQCSYTTHWYLKAVVVLRLEQYFYNTRKMINDMKLITFINS